MISLAVLQAEYFGFSIANLLAVTVDYTYYILLGFIIASVLLSWFPGYPSNRVFQVVYDVVPAVANPILGPLRGRLPTLQIGGIGLDLTPIIAILGLSIARRLLLILIENFIAPVTG